MQPALRLRVQRSEFRESAGKHAPEPVKPVSEKSVMFDLKPQEFEFTPEREEAPNRNGGEREGKRDGGCVK